MKNAMNRLCDVVDFLESAGAARLEVQRLQRRLDALEARREGLRVQQGAVARKISQRIAEERERELTVVSEELESYRRVEAFVAQIPDRTHCTILRRRYLETGKSWTEIQNDLARDGVYYSQRHLQRLHTQALEEARRLWNRDGEEGTVRERR